MKNTIKQLLVLCLSLVLCMALFTACGGNSASDNETSGGMTQGSQSSSSTEDSTTEAHTHSFGEWAVTKAATCTEGGTRERACACGEKETETIAAYDHISGEWVIVKEATKSENGLKEQKCAVCGAQTNEEVLPAIGSLGLAYAVNVDGKTCAITGRGTCTDTEIVIPSVLDGYTVTSIGYYAFWDCSSLTSITIPDSVTIIVERAFSGCYGLTSIEIPDSVTSIGDEAFDNCVSLQGTKYDNAYYLGNADNPYLVLWKGEKSAVSCNIHENTRLIISGAFSGCDRLVSLEIPNDVSSIEGKAFEDCTSLQGTKYDNAYYLGNADNPYLVLWKGEKSADSCNIHENTKLIIGSAFFGCFSLTSVEIPDSVTSMGKGVFSSCVNLKSVTIGSGLTSLAGFTFEHCYSLVDIEIPDGVTSIEAYAFQCCGLTGIKIPDSVMRMGGFVFEDSANLKTVTFTGTKAQWEAIEKIYWNDASSIEKVICTDGEIIL